MFRQTPSIPSPMKTSWCASVILAMTSLLLSPCLHAQAWLGAPGETTVSLSYQQSDFQGHVSETGERQPHGSSKARALDLGIDTVLTPRLAVSFSLPYVSVRNGPEPSPVAGRSGNDDGRDHATWQDYHAEVRYNVVSRGIVVTPFVGLVVPSHHYAVFAEAGQGRDLREVQGGVDLGRLLTSRWHQPYVEARLLYAIPEKVFGISTNRVGVDASLGFFVTPTFSLRGLVNWQRTSGGLTADQVFGPGGPPTPNPNLDPVLFQQHDRLLQDRHLRDGLAASWAVTSNTEVFAGVVRTVSGRNTHYGTGFSVGIARSIKSRR